MLDLNENGNLSSLTSPAASDSKSDVTGRVSFSSKRTSSRKIACLSIREVSRIYGYVSGFNDQDATI